MQNNDVVVASVHMQRIVGDLDRLKQREEELRLEYWGWNAIAQEHVEEYLEERSKEMIG